MKTLQIHNPEMIALGQQMSTEQIIQFLEDFRTLHGGDNTPKSKVISIRIPENLLRLFKSQCDQQGSKYHTQIKALMTHWVKEKSE